MSQEFIHKQTTSFETIDKIRETSLPALLHQQIIKRLRVACIGTFVIVPVAIVTLIFGDTHFPHDFKKAIVCTSASIVVVSSILYLLLKIPMKFANIVRLTILYQILVSFFIAIPYNYKPAYAPMPWTYVFMLSLPLVVPIPPKKTIVASLLSIVAIVFARFFPYLALGGELLSSEAIGATIKTHLFMVPLAFVFSYFVEQSNMEIVKERQKGSYELLNLLGEGNMGKVWYARHRMLRRPAAIKIINPALFGTDDAEEQKRHILRFEREAQATASLYSQHSISLYDFGIMEDGSFFYVMEALDGMDLEDAINTWGPIPVSRAVYLLLQICDSLQEAHQAGIIHRDIKPANIFICHYGFSYDFIKVLDFGMVKQVDEMEASADLAKIENTLNINLSQACMQGTPAYMAPEMIKGQTIDARYDIYALGGVAYWLVTGQLCFPRENLGAMLSAHLQDHVERPSQRTNKPIAKEFEDIILWCLEKEPQNRPKSIEELRERLDQLEIGEKWQQSNAKQCWQSYSSSGEEFKVVDKQLLQLGKYEILGEIGAGGMGKVYRARHTEKSTIVAIKVLKSNAASKANTIQRFSREMDITRQLQHSNIVKMHEMGMVDGKPYFVMDFIEGESLESYIKKQPTYPNIAQIFLEVLNAIQYAHDQRVVHRDLKPANVMMTKQGKPVIMDFGLAKAATSENLTATGSVIGSIYYMSPEQADGVKDQIDEVSDVYSLGAILYEMLTAKPPFTGNNPTEVLARIFNRPPQDPLEINPDIPKELSTICLKALAKNKRERYQSPREMAEDVEKFLSGKKVFITKTKLWNPAIAWIRKYRTMLLFDIVVLVIIALAIFFFYS